MKNSSKITALGIVLVAVAVLLIVGTVLTKAGVIPDLGISFWRILLGSLFLFMLVRALIRVKISHIFIPLAGLFLTFEGTIAEFCGIGGDGIVSNWLVIVIAILLTVGVAILERTLRRKKNLKTGCKRHVNRLGVKTVYVDCKDFKEELFENSLGECEIYFTNTEAYAGGGTLVIDNSRGAMNVYAPKEWKIECNIENHLGEITGCENDTPSDTAKEKILYVKGRNDRGAIRIEKNRNP